MSDEAKVTLSSPQRDKLNEKLGLIVLDIKEKLNTDLDLYYAPLHNKFFRGITGGITFLEIDRLRGDVTTKYTRLSTMLGEVHVEMTRKGYAVQELYLTTLLDGEVTLTGGYAELAAEVLGLSDGS